jgi:hypothetical protein
MSFKKKALILTPSLFFIASFKQYEDPLILKVNKDNPEVLNYVLKKSP